MWDVLGIGCATVDDLLYVPAYPEPDSKMQVNRSERRVGGLTAVALAAAARSGAHCAYAGMLGHDDISRYIEAELRREGIDTGPVIYRDDAQPVHAVIIADMTHSTRNIFYEVKGRIGADDHHPAPDVIRRARVLFIDDYNITGNLRAAAIARDAGIPIVADFERGHVPQFGDLLSLVDHLILSAGAAMRISGADDPAQAVQRLWALGRGVVVVTCGAAGCWYMDADHLEPAHQAAFPVTAVDTTGCGDVFHGAYAAALARDWPLAQRIIFASASAALKASRPGGIAAIPTLAQTRHFLDSMGHLGAIGY
jgi:ribokinase